MAPLIEDIVPAGKEVAMDASIVIHFSEVMDASTVAAIEVTQNGWTGGPKPGKPVPGGWMTGDGRSFRYMTSQAFEPGALVVIRPTDSVRSLSGTALTLAKPIYSFLVDDGCHRGSKEIIIPNIKKTNNGAHNIPMHVTLPEGDGPFPVLYWVHGGAWQGGTPEESVLTPGNQAAYLADHLGVAIVGVSYRCKGSNGTFAEAMEDVADAIEFIRNHAAEYRMDTSRIGLYGGSAGTPLASLTAQRFPEADLFIGYNGIYDFVHVKEGNFGNDNRYLQREPSAEANSAIHNLRNLPPATLLLHGTDDKTIDSQQSVAFAEAVQAAGGHAEVLLYEDEPHAFFNSPRTMEIPTLYEVKTFIRKVWNI